MNIAAMNKGLSAIRFYVAGTVTQWSGDKEAEELIQHEDYKFVREVPIQGTKFTYFSSNTNLPWTLSSTVWGGDYATTVLIQGDDDVAASRGNNSILTNLGHGITETRSIVKPRFVTKSTRSQGSLVVIDETDSRLRTTIFNEAGNHADMSFPNVSQDLIGNRVAINLLSRGELLGMRAIGYMLYIFKTSEIEIVNMQTGVQRLINADVTAWRSIVDTPWGIVYAGDSGIYLIPTDGGPIQDITQSFGISKLYDGTRKTPTNDLPYITSASRQDIVGGYENTYQATWLQIQTTVDGSIFTEPLIYRFYHKVGKVDIRKLGFGDGTLNGLNLRRDRTTTICYADGLLRYPEQGVYQDGVQHTDILPFSADGFETIVRINLGSLTSMVKKFVLHDIRIEHSGSASTGKLFTLNLYRDDSTTPFETKYIPVNQKMVAVGVSPIGDLERVRLEILLPQGDIDSYDGFVIHSIYLGVIFKNELTGNAE
jgi:hypothetical protein